MPQKPPDLDTYGNPITISKPPDLDAFGNIITPAQTVSPQEPGTFWGGVKKSLTGGEALETGLRGAKGYLQGAITDLPSTMWGGLKTIGNLAVSPVETSKEIYEGVKNLPSAVKQTTMQAGSQPEAFGRMMGQVTGQPLTMAGIGAGVSAARPYIPRAIQAAGKPVAATGKFIKKEGLVSGVLPPITVPRYIRHGEQLLGRGLERLGERMKIPKVQGEVVDFPPPIEPPFQEGQIIQEQLPPSSTSFYQGAGEGPIEPLPQGFDELNAIINEPTSPVSADYAFDWPEFNPNGTPEPHFHIRGGPYDKSTVSGQRLDELGIPRPEPNIPPIESSFFERMSPNRPGGINTIRPEVPPGQVTNRQMFERSEALNREPIQPPQQIPGGNEFQPDVQIQNQPVPEVGGTAPIIIQRMDATPKVIKAAKILGYEYQGQDAAGNFILRRKQ